MYQGIYGNLEKDLMEIGNFTYNKSMIIDIFDKLKNDKIKNKSFNKAAVQHYFAKKFYGGRSTIGYLMTKGRIFGISIDSKASQNYSKFDFIFINRFMDMMLDNDKFYENIFNEIRGVDIVKNF